MIEIAGAIGRSLAPMAAAGATPVGNGAAFALSLASFLSLQEGAGEAGAVPMPAVTGQDDATGGNALPDAVETLPEEGAALPAGMVPFMMPVTVPVPEPMPVDPARPVAVRSEPSAPAIAADPVVPGVQYGGAARPAMLAGTGLAVVQLATAAAGEPATLDMPPAGSVLPEVGRASVDPGSPEVSSASTKPPQIAAGGEAGRSAVAPASVVRPDTGAAFAITPDGSAVAMPVPARFVTAPAEPVVLAGVKVIEPGTDAVRQPVTAIRVAGGEAPVPARFVVPAATEGGTDRAAAAGDAQVAPTLAAREPAATTGSMTPAANDIAAARTPAADGAGRMGRDGSATIRPAAAFDTTQVPVAMDRGVPVAEGTAPIKAGDAAPAFQLFASALHRDAGGHEDRRGAIDTVTAPTLVAPVTTVPAAAATQDAPLDMRQEQWPQGMIDRIEALRDQADANDTRIRLVPDALGTIDIAISRRDDQVHVRFEAEQAQTRAMLAQAQPELNALATARGLKLGEATPDARHATGGGQDMSQNPGQDRAFTQQQHQPRTMRNRASGGTPADSRPDDRAAATRIA